MDKIKWTSAMLADLQTLQAIHGLTEDAINSVLSDLIFGTLQIVKGMLVRETGTPSGQVYVNLGNAIGAGGEKITVDSDQLVNILVGTGGAPPPPVASWGDGLFSHPTNNRVDIVGIKFIDYDGQNESTWFIDDTTSPPTKYSSLADKRIYDFYIIEVFHGPDDGSEADPPVPPDYIQLARIFVNAGATVIVNNDITQLTLPIAGSFDSLLDFIKHHIHDATDGSDRIDYNDLLNIPPLTIPNHSQLLDIVADPDLVTDHDGRYDARYGGASWAGVATLRKLVEAIINNSTALTEADINLGTVFNDFKAKISNADTTTNFLENKIVAGSGAVVTKLNVGGNEQLEISLGSISQLKIVSGVTYHGRAVNFLTASYGGGGGLPPTFPTTTESEAYNGAAGAFISPPNVMVSFRNSIAFGSVTRGDTDHQQTGFYAREKNVTASGFDVEAKIHSEGGTYEGWVSWIAIGMSA